MAVVDNRDGTFSITDDVTGEVLEVRGTRRSSSGGTTETTRQREQFQLEERRRSSSGDGRIREIESNYDGIYPSDPPTIQDGAVTLEIRPPAGIGPTAPTQQVAGTISLASVAAVALPVARAIATFLFSQGARFGSRIPWNRIPGWVRAALLALGFQQGADLLFDFGQDDSGVIDVPFIDRTPDTPPPPDGEDNDSKLVRALYVGGWFAGMVAFYRLSDGRLATRNKHGVWKIWRPKKPIVLFATGNRDLQDVFRADRVLDKEADKMARLLRNRGKQVRNKVNPDSRRAMED